MTYRLMTHENQHGFGVSLTKYNGYDGELLNGFVLNTFPTQPERKKYLDELVKITGYEIETL